MTARVCFSLITALLCLSVYLSTTDAEGAAAGENSFIFITQREEMYKSELVYKNYFRHISELMNII